MLDMVCERDVSLPSPSEYSRLLPLVSSPAGTGITELFTSIISSRLCDEEIDITFTGLFSLLTLPAPRLRLVFGSPTLLLFNFAFTCAASKSRLLPLLDGRFKLMERALSIEAKSSPLLSFVELWTGAVLLLPRRWLGAL